MDRYNRMAATLSRLGAILPLLLGTNPVRAQTPPAASPPLESASSPPALACGVTLSAPIAAVWRDLGGETGRLGCPTQKEGPSPTSAQGSAARLAVFGTNGEIILHVAGPRAGQAFAVSGCFYRLHSQFSGTGGWLGLPIADQENTPDGSRQAFEGGIMRYARALDECEATPLAGAASPTKAEQTALDLYENATSGDRRSLASRVSAQAATAAGYVRLRSQASVAITADADSTPLKLYVNETSGLSETLATAQSEREALAAGYVFAGNQGYVWTGPRPGVAPLKLYRDAAGHSRLAVGAQDEREAAAAGFQFTRIEGYVPAP